MSRKILLVLSLIAVSSLLLVGAYGSNTTSAASSRLRSALPAAVLTSAAHALQATSTEMSAAAKPKTIPNSYIIRLADTPLAGYDGAVAGFAATSPSVTGKKLDVNSLASKTYVSYLERQQATALQRIERALGTSVKVKAQYQAAFNGLAVTMSAAQAAKVAALPGVLSVTPEMVYEAKTDAGPAWIKAVQPDLQAALFRTELSGLNTIPPTTATTATGTGLFTYDSTSQTLNYNLTLSGVLTATSAGIYSGTVGFTSAVALANLISVTPGVYIGNATLTITDATSLYATGLYVSVTSTTSPTVEIRGQIVPSKGEGILVGVIDTGINLEHSSFAALGGDGYNHINPKGAGVYVGACDPTNLPASPERASGYNPVIAPFCNDKLIGTWTFSDTALFSDTTGLPSPADDNGHGSHTASTAAGNVTDSVIQGASTGRISGVAAHANIIAYDIANNNPATGSASASTSTILAAINQAINDGVQVINYSFGSGPNPQSPWEDSIGISYFNAANAGILVSISAGNDGPGAATVEAPAPWVMTVAASTHNRIFVNSVTDLAGGSTTITPTTIFGKGVSTGMTVTLPIVYAGNYTDTAGISNPLCLPFFNASVDFTGKIVVCDRGNNARVDKAINVAAAKGAGFILANNASSGDSLISDPFVIPGVHITYNDGVTLENWLATGSGHVGRIPGTYPDKQPAYGDIMASFSSRGPLPALNLLKPDVSAPGVDILAAYANVGPGDEFTLASGTSMAAPHNAGATALIRQAHPDWSVAEVQSALMLTAVNDTMRKEDGVTPADPFDDGAGRIDVSKAVMTGLVLNESLRNMALADPKVGGNPTTLNRASIMDDSCVVSCIWTRTFSSTLATTATWTLTATSSPSITLMVEPTTFVIGPFGTQTVTVTADVSALPLDGTYAFGRVALTENNGLAPQAGMPVVVRAKASTIPSTQLIETTSTTGTKVLQATRAITISDLSKTIYGLHKGEETNIAIAQDSNNSSPFDDLSDGVFVKNVQVVTGTTRLVADIGATTASDLDMYVIYDFNGNGVIDVNADMLACQSATSAALEYCSITDPFPGLYFVLVQNYTGSGAAQDSIKFFTAAVGNSDAGNFTVTGPTTQALGVPFDLNLNWNIPNLSSGDRYYGSFETKTITNGTSLGVTAVDLRNVASGIEVSKVASLSQAYLGEPVRYAITLTAPTTQTVALTDTLPLGAALITTTLSPDVSYDAISHTITFNGDVSGTKAIRYYATMELTGTLTNDVTVRVGNTTKTASTSVLVAGALPPSTLSKVASTSVAQRGDVISYTIVLTTPKLLPVVLTDTLPLAAELVAGTLTGGATYDAGSRTITFNGSVSGTHTVNYDATMVQNGPITNVATLKVRTQVAEATAVVVVSEPAHVSKVASTSIALLGDTVGYTLTVTTPALQLVVLTDTLPLGANLITSTLRGGATYDAANRTITFNGAVNGSKTITYSAALTLTGSLTNGVTVTSKGRSEQSSASVQVFEPASVSKVASTNEVGLGSTVGYTLTITTFIAQPVVLTDALPPGANLITTTLSSDASYDAASRTITFNGNVAGSKSIVYSATLTQTGSITNVATLTAAGRTAQATATVTVTAPSLVSNYNDGAPGSTFVITGTHYQANTTYEVLINGTAITPTVATTATGQFVISLKTASTAHAGRYDVQVRVFTPALQATTSATDVAYTLDPTKPVRQAPATGGGMVVNVPTTIAPVLNLKYVFLPSISR